MLHAEVCNTSPQFNAIKPPDWGTLTQLLHYLRHLKQEKMPESVGLAPKVIAWSPKLCSADMASLTCRVLVWSSMYKKSFHPLAQSPEITSAIATLSNVEVDQNSWEWKKGRCFQLACQSKLKHALLYIVIRVNCISTDDFIEILIFLSVAVEQ